MNALKIILGCIIVFILIRIWKLFKINYQAKKFFSMAIESEILYQIFNSAENEKNVNFNITENDVKDILCTVENTIKYYDEAQLANYQNECAMEIYSHLIQMASDLRRWIWVNKK
ncbi:MAG: hypothetical protein J6K42_05780 [Clostridia bacterium]|nr:hypothetical protein [Clostridia bacterium]